MRSFRDFREDQDGLAMVLVAIMLPVLVGFALLVIDGSRVGNLHNDTQRGADALAVAAAAELDGGPDSWTRAERALEFLVHNDTRFSDEDDGDADPNRYKLDSIGAVTSLSASCRERGTISWCFLEDLPASDADPITAANHAATPGDTRLIEVTVNPQGFTTIFPVSLLGGSNTMTIGATAVAGFKSAVCEFTPMFICNPYPSMDAFGATLSGNQRPMMLLKKHTGGSTSQYGPGNYGFLQTPEGELSVPALTQMFASTSPAACFGTEGVDTRPGNIPPVNDGINVRFDIFPNGGGPNGIDPATYPPAPVTIKGMVTKPTGQCGYDAPNATQAPNYKAVPRDNCFNSGTCTIPSGGAESRLGTGDWDRAGYWSVNHPATSYASTGLPADASRYQVYKWEADHLSDHGAEQAGPSCNAAPEPIDKSRRLVYIAIIDCVANSVKGSGGNYPVEAFASFFLTEPAGGPPNSDIYGEIVDVTTRKGSGTLDDFVRDEAQLYR